MGRRKLADRTFFVVKRVGKALHEHLMLPDGCTALVGLSGGPVSLAMLHALVIRLRRIPITFTLLPVHFPDGVHGDGAEVAVLLRTECEKLGLELVLGEEAPGPGEHFQPVPHRAAFLRLAAEYGAHAVVLGHTMQDRAMAVMLAMLESGRLTGLPVVEEAKEGSDCRFVRPLCLLTSEAIMEMVVEEGLPVLIPRVPRPGQAARREIDEFLRSRHGRLIERLRNISNAPDKVIEEYLA